MKVKQKIKQKNKLGYGQCKDCIWYKEKWYGQLVCDVERDSTICRRNRKERK